MADIKLSVNNQVPVIAKVYPAGSGSGSSGPATTTTFSVISEATTNLAPGSYIIDATAGSFTITLAAGSGTWEFSDSKMTTTANPVNIGTPLQTFTTASGTQGAGSYVINYDGAHLKVANVGTANEFLIVHEPDQIDNHVIIPATSAVSSASEDDALLANASGEFYPVPLNTIVTNAALSTQGYYGMLTGFYYGGSATETVITASDVGNWIDINFTMDSSGEFDYRPTAMQEAQSAATTGSGTQADPFVFLLEGLGLTSFVNFRASMSFEPDVDESELETRLLFNRHSGTTPSTDFSIEEVSLNMTQGADIDYPAEPMLSFFVGDTIDTNGAGDAGKCRFQVKASVEGTLRLRALTWYINS